MTNPDILDEKIEDPKQHRTWWTLKFNLRIAYIILIFLALNSLYNELFKSVAIFEELVLIIMSSLMLFYIQSSGDVKSLMDKQSRSNFYAFVYKLIYIITVLMGCFLIILAITLFYLKSNQPILFHELAVLLLILFLGFGQLVYSYRTRFLINY